MEVSDFKFYGFGELWKPILCPWPDWNHGLFLQHTGLEHTNNVQLLRGSSTFILLLYYVCRSNRPGRHKIEIKMFTHLKIA